MEFSNAKKNTFLIFEKKNNNKPNRLQIYIEKEISSDGNEFINVLNILHEYMEKYVQMLLKMVLWLNSVDSSAFAAFLKMKREIEKGRERQRERNNLFIYFNWGK